MAWICDYVLMDERRTWRRGQLVVTWVATVAMAVGLTVIVMYETRPWPASPTASPTVTASSAPTTPAADPYAIYLARNPNPKLVLSRDDAQARALLGCGKTWAAGTVDAVLADAYRPTGICQHG